MLNLLLAGLLMALSVARGTITVSTGGIGTTFDVSGLAFQPKAILFFWSGRSTSGFSEEDSRFGAGVAVSTTDRRAYSNVSRHANASSSAFGMRRSDCCIATISTGAVVNGRADLNAINSDGFQLIIDQAFAAALQVSWLALGGDDLTLAQLVDITMPAATGTQDVATSSALDTGDDDKAVLFFGVGSNTTNSPENSSRFSFGAAAGDTPVNAVLEGMSRTGRPTTVTHNYSRVGHCILAPNGAADDAILGYAELTAWLSTGFRLSWTIVSSATVHLTALVLKGGRYEVGSALTSTGTSNQAEATTYQPKALLIASHAKAESSSGTLQTIGDERSIGIALGAADRACVSMHDRDNFASSDIALGYHEDRVYNNIDNIAPASIEGVADLVSLDATPGFTFVMDDADPSAAFFWYLLFADIPVGGGATNIDPGFIATTVQLFAPELLEGEAIVAGFINNAATVNAPEVIAADILLPGFIANVPQLFDPTIDSPVAILPGFIASSVQVFEPGIGEGIGTEFIASTAIVYAPNVVHASILLPGFIASTAQVFDPNFGGADIIDVGAFTPTSVLFAPTFVLAQTLDVGALTHQSQVFAPSLETFLELYAYLFADLSAPRHAFDSRSAARFDFLGKSAALAQFEDNSA